MEGPREKIQLQEQQQKHQECQDIETQPLENSTRLLDPDAVGQLSVVKRGSTRLCHKSAAAVVCAAVGAAMVVVGALGMEDCPGEPMMPIWLLGTSYTRTVCHTHKCILHDPRITDRQVLLISVNWYRSHATKTICE